MNDALDTLEVIIERWWAARRAGVVPFAPPLHLPWAAQIGLAMLGVPAQIRAFRDDDAPTFALHHDLANASPRSWVWILPVRAGFSAMVARFRGTKNHALYADYQKAVAEDEGQQSSMASLRGPDMVDLVAFSPDLARCHGRLNGMATVLGDPQHSDAHEKPVRLFRDVAGWLAARCAGVVLVGTADENLEWLRGCAAGIVTDDLAHGKAVKKMLARPYAGPDVLVAG